MSSPPQPPHVSLSTTRRIIRQCLHSYMHRHLIRQNVASLQQSRQAGPAPEPDPKRIFKPLEDYIAACFQSVDCLNKSFLRDLPPAPSSQNSKQFQIPRKPLGSVDKKTPEATPPESSERHMWDTSLKLDPRMLMIGDVAENGRWFTGDIASPEETVSPTGRPSTRGDTASSSTSHNRLIDVHWSAVGDWYNAVLHAGADWVSVFDELSSSPGYIAQTDRDIAILEREILLAQSHVERALMRTTEGLLKRPGRPLAAAEDLNFLLILLENPLLHASTKSESTHNQHGSNRRQPRDGVLSGPLSGQHSAIIKRIVGLISNSPDEWHSALTKWLARCEVQRFEKIKDFASGFLTYRLLRNQDKKQTVKPEKVDFTSDLIPEMQIGRNGNYIHDDISVLRPQKKNKEQTKLISYIDDWQVKAAAKVLSIIFAANESARSSRSRRRPLPVSDFYVSMVDSVDLVADFEAWESKRGKFSFCQYPFLMSIWAKIQILGYETRRQMQLKARDAFLDSIMSRKNVNQYLFLNVRRDCLVEDSLNAVGDVLGSGSEDLKKGLRITFVGEEGIDGGGLRKEWFLLLVREVFNPDHGLFLYDEDSQYCYFNPNTFETSDQFFLVGVVVGLAIYNSTILDVPLPPFTFQKLLAAAPVYSGLQPTKQMKYTVYHLAEYQPRVAKGLQDLLDFEGDVENTFMLDFVIETERYGTKTPVPLCRDGERRPVTNANRREYVDLYIRYVLEAAVSRQFDAFKRGFYTVCGGNGFSLFRSEEIELLVRGSDEPLDVAALRAVATYDNWGTKNPDGTEPIIDWFWKSLSWASPNDQRKLLLFVTGSDRLPATGASALSIKISCLGNETNRYPIARTCFNQLSLWRYKSSDQLQYMLWRAVFESEGFGLK